MASRPDAAATAALGAEVVQPQWLSWIDIAGDPVFATTWPVDLTPSGTGDPDLDGKTFFALKPELVSVSPVQHSRDGAGTVTASLSGLPVADAEVYAAIADEASWKGRDARFWVLIRDAAGIQQGAIFAYHTGRITQLEVIFGQEEQTIQLSVETYLSLITPPSNRTYMDQAWFDPADRSAEVAAAIANGISNNPIGLGAAVGIGAGGRSVRSVAAELF